MVNEFVIPLLAIFTPAIMALTCLSAAGRIDDIATGAETTA